MKTSRIFVILVTLIMGCLISGNAFANEHSNRLKKFNTDKQEAFLMIIVISTQQPCSNPRNPYYQGQDPDGNAYWNITCNEGAYNVQIANDSKGSTKCLPCSVMKAIGAPCYKKY